MNDTNFIYLPADGKEHGRWINLSLVWHVSEDPQYEDSAIVSGIGDQQIFLRGRQAKLLIKRIESKESF